MGRLNTGRFLSILIIVILEFKIRLLSGVNQMNYPFLDNTARRMMRSNYSY